MLRVIFVRYRVPTSFLIPELALQITCKLGIWDSMMCIEITEGALKNSPSCDQVIEEVIPIIKW